MNKQELIKQILNGATFNDISKNDLLEHFEVEHDLSGKTVDFRLYVDANRTHFVEFGDELEESLEEYVYNISSCEQEFRFYSIDNSFDDLAAFIDSLESEM